ncbi:Uncharacterized conserved protein [Acholeplasma oculi]|uniref:GyrI-like bacterial transcription activator n=1 Tax=Acholeplasma oculi TaxID=35623 RepID=A0A061A9U6_9MOLU|nr:GyrI-like domain-containing protein [Acholeplasma oculi]CDR30643.1 GyrI-like bacterial transcription activator [Acholeplasma oculi]SKC45901.1 hypothetical protein SAMN02745122_1180 [Acholeplasma oculi]SUT89392.1 Uncharacterized conserved protein [Acholeplasma oculi]
MDIKKNKVLYPNKQIPSILHIQESKFLMIQGRGNPNDINSSYKDDVSKLYQVAYTIRMSYKNNYLIKGFEPFTVAPLEGYWYQEGIEGFDPLRKDLFVYKLMIPMPDFIHEKDYLWAIQFIKVKKGMDLSEVKFLIYEEGLVVQMLHIGPYDTEVQTIQQMNEFMNQEGYEIDFSPERLHHEIYLSDPRKVSSEKLKTIIRHPIKKRGNV